MSEQISLGLLVLVGSLAGSFFLWLGTRGKTRAEAVTAKVAAEQADLAARFDDASELARYIDDRVEAKVAPIRQELARVKKEADEFAGAVRTRETQLWLWDQRGRAGALPMLPGPILITLGLGHLTEDWNTEPPERTAS